MERRCAEWISGLAAMRRVAMLIGLVALAELGCQPVSSQPVAAEPPAAVAPPAAPGQVAVPPAARPGREYWDAIFFDQKQAGYAHTVYEPVDENGQRLVRIRATSELTLLRFNQPTRQQLRYESVETEAGEVLRFSSSLTSGEGPGVALAASGHVRGPRLEMELTTVGKTQQASLPWESGWGGYFAMEQTLERRPLAPGETRTLRALTPGFNQTAEIEYRARDWETTNLLEGDRRLLRIDTRLKLAGTTLEQTIWTDEAGQTWKSEIAVLKQTSYRTTKERALAKSTPSFDLGKQSTVTVRQPLAAPHRTRRVVYRVRLTTGDPSQVFPATATQTVRKVDAQTAEIIVRALPADPSADPQFPASLPPGPDDLAANSLIQGDDPEIQKLAQQAAPDQSDPAAVARALEKLVRQSVTNKNFSQALASAAEVARSREGDCTEHAVLLAALCRARQIPSRVVIGLVYYEPSRGFAYHMWTEAWTGKAWLPLDGTLGQGGIGAAHLIVSYSNLKGVDPLTQFLPVLKLIGKLSVEIVESN